MHELIRVNILDLLSIINSTARMKGKSEAKLENDILKLKVKQLEGELTKSRTRASLD